MDRAMRLFDEAHSTAALKPLSSVTLLRTIPARQTRSVSGENVLHGQKVCFYRRRSADQKAPRRTGGAGRSRRRPTARPAGGAAGSIGATRRCGGRGNGSSDGRAAGLLGDERGEKNRVNTFLSLSNSITNSASPRTRVSSKSSLDQLSDRIDYRSFSALSSTGYPSFVGPTTHPPFITCHKKLSSRSEKAYRRLSNIASED